MPKSSSALRLPVRGHKNRDLRVGGVPVREPNGRVIAIVRQEGPVRVLVRGVGPRHLYRARDAWSLGDRALEQARVARVDVLRYIALAGVYEVPFAAFVEQAERLPFAHEPQWVLPRSRWRFTPRAPQGEQLALGVGA